MASRPMIRILGALVFGLAPWAPVSAQVPAGPEFRVNTYTTGTQQSAFPAHVTAVAPDGDIVIVWNSDSQDGSQGGIYGQRLTASGAPENGEFRANTFTTGNQHSPSVGVDGRGNTILVWASAGQDGSLSGVYAQRYDASGAALGSEFSINAYTTGRQEDPTVAAGPSGDFVVAWTSFDGDSYGVAARRFDANGAPRGGEFRVNSYTSGSQQRPSIDVDAAGNYVVAWESFGQLPMPSGPEIFAQRLDGFGNRRGAEFQVSNLGSGYRARVGVGGAGDFVVAWTGSGSFDGAFARRFDASGAPAGPAFMVNTYTTGTQYKADVDANANGDFVVTWTNSQPSTSTVSAQRFDSTGVRRGGEFRVDSGSTFSIYPSVGSDRVGNFVVAWASYDGSLFGMFAQRFGGLLPVAVSVDPSPSGSSNGNGIFEAGESVIVAPSWRNVNGATQSFSGAGSSLIGPGSPGDPIYLVKNGSANYGAVTNGATASCTASADCYLMAATVPSARPVRHWDASFREDILPVSQGQSKTWTLHVGDSFTDVLRSNPFYRYIETLLHNGVTTGCGPTQYCPAGATSREQMAVFVLVAREGVGYAPPPCGPTPIFADVPASSPFCRWIEELARRGVVAGCTAGNYCPSAPVARDQMAVFVLRTLDAAINPPACVPPNVYGDVPETSPFCRWVEELTLRGVVAGCGSGNYCPAAPVTREEMSVFLGVTFGLRLYGL